MADANVESGPLFNLLTDALRAGPGSPEWHQAVSKLRAEGLAEAEEYRLLVAVREHLESGRDYRSIRAGPGFTRKVLDAIERHEVDAGKRSRLPLANIIAVISVIAIVVVVAYVGNQMLGRRDVTDTTIEELDTTYFPTEVTSAKFETASAGPSPLIPPSGWRHLGALPLEASRNGLRPVVDSAAAAEQTTIGGAVVAETTLPPEQPFAVEVQYRAGRLPEDLIVQVFVSAGNDFSPDKATSGNELVWLLQGTRQKVVTGDGRFVYDQPRPDPADKNEPRTVRLIVGREKAVVQDGGQRLWSGTSGLAAEARTVGVRFLRLQDGKPAENVSIHSVRVLTR